MRKNNKMTLQDRLTIQEMYYERKSFLEIGRAIDYSHTAVANEIARNGKPITPSSYTLKKAQGRNYSIGLVKRIILHKNVKLIHFSEKGTVMSKKLWQHICYEATYNKKSFEKSLIEYKHKHPNKKPPCLKTVYNFYARIIKENKFLLNFHTIKYTKHHIDDGALIHNFGQSIETRPESINNRVEFGHLEIDCIESNRNENTALLTIVERKTRFSKIYYLKNNDSFHVNTQLNKFIKEFGIHNIKSITTDNGSEFKKLNEVFTNNIIPIYLCHPKNLTKKEQLREKIEKLGNFSRKEQILVV